MKTTQDKRIAVRPPEPSPLDRLARVEVIREAAVRLFRRHGYHATTMRELAREVGLEAPSLYNHFASKHDLLAEILTGAMRELVDGVRTAVAAAGTDPASRLRAAIRAYVMFHEHNLAEASISDSERRALHGRAATRLAAQRRELSDVFRDVINDGVRSGSFKVPDTSVATIAVLSMCARLPVWFRPDGRLPLGTIASLLEELALQTLGAVPARRGRRSK